MHFRRHIRKLAPRPYGYSIMEIVVTAAIIGILVLILAPVVADRSRQAKIRACEQDLENLAAAQERAYIDTGYMYRVCVLDDVKGGDGAPNNLPLADRVDGIRDEQFNTDLTPEGKMIFILMGLTDPNVDQDFHQSVIAANAIFDNKIVFNGETSFNWQGPYCTWHRDLNRNDWPDDPWGSDYLFFTKQGVLVPTESDFITDFQIPGLPATAVAALGAPPLDPQGIFSRPTFLSLGPDGLPGDGALNPNGDGQFGTGDDIVRSF